MYDANMSVCIYVYKFMHKKISASGWASSGITGVATFRDKLKDNWTPKSLDPGLHQFTSAPGCIQEHQGKNHSPFLLIPCSVALFRPSPQTRHALSSISNYLCPTCLPRLLRYVFLQGSKSWLTLLQDLLTIPFSPVTFNTHLFSTNF